MQLEWWAWIVGGIGLIVAELAIPSFFVIWFGLGYWLAMLVAASVVAAKRPAVPTGRPSCTRAMAPTVSRCSSSA